MKILVVASEVAPIIKLGGLGDVIGSLPKALALLGVDVDVLVPFFPVARLDKVQLYKAFTLDVPYDGKNNVVDVYKTRLPDSAVDVFLLKNEYYFESGGKDAFANNIKETEMFSFFDRAVVEYVKARFNVYDVVHCNDWHTGLVPGLLQDELGSERPATVFTIHNLLYQGIGGFALARAVDINMSAHAEVLWDMSDGDLNLMQEGLSSADYINAVSPSYAEEIKVRKFGEKQAELLKDRQGRLVGVLNGIDYHAFSRTFSIGDWQLGKINAKKELLAKLGYSVRAGFSDEILSGTPVFSFVSRLDPNQKGVDLLLDAVPEIVKAGGVFVLLGIGSKEWETKLQGLEVKYPNAVFIKIMFDVDLANLIYSGSDFLLIPSRYEPCGLTQMIAMHYGTLPVVHNVGGLKDSVEDGVTGFKFNVYSSPALVEAIKKALTVYKNSRVYEDMVKAAINADFSWGKSAILYKELYAKAVEAHLDAVNLAQETL